MIDKLISHQKFTFSFFKTSSPFKGVHRHPVNGCPPGSATVRKLHTMTLYAV